MAYFKYFPNVYVRNRTFQNGNHPYELTKNIFRRIKIKEKIVGKLLGFTQYSIKEGERPDMVAKKVYGDSGLDWVVLLCNNIINVNEEWPVTRDELYAICQDRFGDVDSVSHYETREILDHNDNVILPEGIVVNEDYQYIKPDGTLYPKTDSRRPVSNFEKLDAENEYKRNIHLLRGAYIDDFVNEFRRLAKYLPNDEVDAKGNKKTPTTLAEEFIGITNYRKPSQSTASTGSARGGGSSTALISSGGGGAGAVTSAVDADTDNTQASTTTTSTSSTSSGSYTGTQTGSGDTSSSSSSSSSSSGSSSSGGSSSGGGYGGY